MKLSAVCSFIFLLFIPVYSYGRQQIYKDYPISMVDINKVRITDDFWLPKIKTVQNTTISFAFEKCRSEGRMDNFLIAGGKWNIPGGKQGKVLGKMPFDDSDVYKIIEGASYSLITVPDKKLDAYLDSVIDIIRTGQEPDGYITTWFTIDPNNPPAPWVQKTGPRWTRVAASHELYNSGHLFEAAAAHYLATGKRNLLDIALKNADLLVDNFGPGKLTIPPGHQIIETGLIKLYRITGNIKYLQLAKYFLDLRGDPKTHALFGAYSQDHIPVTQQTEITGHAVRAVYMYAGMTDIAAIYGDQSYLKAVNNIWTNLIERKMYITGGIGAKHEQEALGADYELPNLTAYAETCAAIGSVYWNNRLFMLTGDAKYFDVIERTLYNGLLAGISLDGKSFFYVNPLEADGKFVFNQGAKTRQSWFDCSCCPTNLVRFIPSLPGLVYARQKNDLFVNLYVSSKAKVTVNNKPVTIEQKTDYPWQGDVHIIITPEKHRRFTLKLRIPGWAQNQPLPGGLYSYTDTVKDKPVITVNGKEIKYDTQLGYTAITRKWKAGDRITIKLPMNIRRVIANEKVQDDRGKAALEFGPIVYCVEGIDNGNKLDNLTLPDNAVLKVEKRNALLNGVNVITGGVPFRNDHGLLKLTAIPYYAWSNRGAGTMKVWLPRK
ncbi:MAG: glycoside hydrolase family 127 protein [Sedimentisphaerales bacterium]|nr:glycoside hydrolase family 127 protein [Sedimentisphaerales bacterium]